MKAEGPALPRATPAMARNVWEAQRRPSARTVARALTLSGRPISFVAVARWRANDWRPVKSNHQLEVARSQLEAFAPLASGEPETVIENLIDDPARRLELDELTDAEILRRTARETAIATAIVGKAIQDRATSAFNPAELTPALSVLAQCLHVLLGSFEQATKLREAEQRTTIPRKVANPNDNPKWGESNVR
jgi:hypothetical protein